MHYNKLEGIQLLYSSFFRRKKQTKSRKDALKNIIFHRRFFFAIIRKRKWGVRCIDVDSSLNIIAFSSRSLDAKLESKEVSYHFKTEFWQKRIKET